MPQPYKWNSRCVHVTFTKFLRTFGRLLLCIDVYCGQLLVFPNNFSRICFRKLKMRMIYHMNNPFRSSHPEVFRRKGVLKICSKSLGENTCRSVISIKSQSNFIEIILRHGFSRKDQGKSSCRLFMSNFKIHFPFKNIFVYVRNNYVL